MSPISVSDLVNKAVARAGALPLPESTYRFQFHAGFQFQDAVRVLPYLRDLGVTHVYASPYLKARPGSTHGYDIVDHRCINPEIGTPEDHEAFVNAVRDAGLGLILDIVPNHMGVATNENVWWNDVLENGPASPFAGYFDIAWDETARPELLHKVLLPVLGEPYGDALEGGQLKLKYDSGRFVVDYFGRLLPIAPRSYALVLRHRLPQLEQSLGPGSAELAEYLSVLTAVGHLPDRTETEPARIAERHREKEVIKRRLGELTATNATVRAFVEQNVSVFNGTVGEPHSFDPLDDLLAHQCYRLSFWRVALEEINYRRFFDVNELAAICVEREDVFAAVHQLIFKFIREGNVSGVRVDHPDGLYDPREYFFRLQRQYLLTLTKELFEAEAMGTEGGAWADAQKEATEAIDKFLLTPPTRPSGRPLYVVAEKILGSAEPLPDEWAVHGTTGYDFIRAVSGLFVDDTEGDFTRLYKGLVGDDSAFADVLYRSKRLILNASLAAELNMLTSQLDRLAQKTRKSRDFTRNGLREALREVIACFPVYRTYISEQGVSDRDREVVERAVKRAGQRNPFINPSVLRFTKDMILLRHPDEASEADRHEQLRFTRKLQQLTSPVMAKGLEDTSFYIYNRLVSLNEVGGSPEWPKNAVESFHRFNADRAARWPHSLAPLSTHDTKRSEDVRARISVLSEMPAAWAGSVRRWFDLNAGCRTDFESGPAPDANEEYLIYQTLIGAWPVEPDEFGPAFVDRIKAYLVKALREAKVHSSWLIPNAEYDGAVQSFVGRILDPGKSRAFLDDFRPFQKRVAFFGAVNSLAQTLLKLTAPGVADTYQGTEVPDFSLVDPDNRRPVDYALRQAVLTDLRQAVQAAQETLPSFAAELTRSIEDGRAKLFLTTRTLTTRREHPGLFAGGEYIPLVPEGKAAPHVFAFARRHNGVTAIVVVPRLVARASADAAELRFDAGRFAGARLDLSGLGPGSRWENVLTGSRITAADGIVQADDLFAHFPVALLLSNT